ncbi:precorrin-6A reductase [Jatrophihabitans endophyticus]|uniref:Precorrin-6A reductase n=1 Tax=Jatrophihabitans endophyticus TaxID=1206085 RepID=A0A1M5Q6M3_9ACTN|nr:precorrin-6A reductase [Jatrophihabitans endophyticus]
MLVLGGTGEARDLARRLVTAGADVTSSLAGRVSRPALPVGDVRIGGFGGAAGLAEFLREFAPTIVVDATHPFAATISANAAAACAATSVPLLVVCRPGWTARAGDDWTRVSDIAAAAEHVRTSPAGTVFLTTGRRDLAVFADDDRHDYLVRIVDPPDVPLPPRTTLLLDRGPYDLDRERALLQAHDVRLLVTKDSGGPLTVAKLDAARELGVPVLVVDRPPLPDGVTAVDTVDAVLSRLPGSAAG